MQIVLHIKFNSRPKSIFEGCLQPTVLLIFHHLALLACINRSLYFKPSNHLNACVSELVLLVAMFIDSSNHLSTMKKKKANYKIKTCIINIILDVQYLHYPFMSPYRRAVIAPIKC